MAGKFGGKRQMLAGELDDDHFVHYLECDPSLLHQIGSDE